MTRDEHLADVLASMAAALGWCVGVIEGKGVDKDVPTWVRNALSDAQHPIAQADLRARVSAGRGVVVNGSG